MKLSPVLPLGVVLVSLSVGCSGLFESNSGRKSSSNGNEPAEAGTTPASPTDTPPGPGPSEMPTVPTAPSPGACTLPGTPLAVQTRRLTPRQYQTTLEAGLGLSLQPAELPQFQDDNPTIGLANDPQKLRITTVSVDSLYASLLAVSKRSLANVSDVQSCISATGTACFEQLIDSLGQKLWRRPVAAEEKADLLAGVASVAAASGTREDQADFLLQALQFSPNTLYRLELGDATGNLTDQELASLLSYTFWDAPPDAALFAAAQAGTLHTPGVLKSEAQRLAQDPRFPKAVAGFLWDFLKLENIYTKKKDDTLGLTPAVRSTLAASASGTLDQALTSGQASLLDVFSGVSFPVNDELAPFFGVPAVGTSQLTPQSLSPEQRLGILSHPGFLTVHAGEGSTSIVKRGVFVLEQLLGVKIPAPPPNVQGIDPATIPNLDTATTSARELLKVTHSAQPACNGCHSIIDPAGFGLENFDTVGHFRTVEKQTVPIDASGSITVGSETLTYTNSIEYIRALSSSQALRNAVVEHYFAYALGQLGDGCEAHRFSEAIAKANDSLSALPTELVATQSFVRRAPTP
ncbi:MAG: DUF1588 domain-containing protein [Polyangiaceae bacterium]|nr:DUF1588 domain-containing protein [Polyangiaceae bacterium]